MRWSFTLVYWLLKYGNTSHQIIRGIRRLNHCAELCHLLWLQRTLQLYSYNISMVFLFKLLELYSLFSWKYDFTLEIFLVFFTEQNSAVTWTGEVVHVLLLTNVIQLSWVSPDLVGDANKVVTQTSGLWKLLQVKLPNKRPPGIKISQHLLQDPTFSSSSWPSLYIKTFS